MGLLGAGARGRRVDPGRARQGEGVGGPGRVKRARHVPHAMPYCNIPRVCAFLVVRSGYKLETLSYLIPTWGNKTRTRVPRELDFVGFTARAWRKVGMAAADDDDMTLEKLEEKASNLRAKKNPLYHSKAHTGLWAGRGPFRIASAR